MPYAHILSEKPCPKCGWMGEHECKNIVEIPSTEKEPQQEPPLMNQIRDFLRISYTAFVPEHRQKMRNALKFWCKRHEGCVMAAPHDSKYPWIDFQLTANLPELK